MNKNFKIICEFKKVNKELNLSFGKKHINIYDKSTKIKILYSDILEMYNRNKEELVLFLKNRETCLIFSVEIDCIYDLICKKQRELDIQNNEKSEQKGKYNNILEKVCFVFKRELVDLFKIVIWIFILIGCMDLCKKLFNLTALGIPVTLCIAYLYLKYIYEPRENEKNRTKNELNFLKLEKFRLTYQTYNFTELKKEYDILKKIENSGIDGINREEWIEAQARLNILDDFLKLQTDKINK
jgi:hypothetical protein